MSEQDKQNPSEPPRPESVATSPDLETAGAEAAPLAATTQAEHSPVPADNPAAETTNASAGSPSASAAADVTQQSEPSAEPLRDEPASGHDEGADVAPPSVQAEASVSSPTLTIRELMTAGVHFGHQTRRWNPRMKPYIYGVRNGIHIVNLDVSIRLMRRALQFVETLTSRGGSVLFVGTKTQAVDIIAEEATRAQQFFVTGRWLGGTLTNFRTVRSSIDRLKDLEQRDEDGSLDLLTKREALGLRRDITKLRKYLGGIKNIGGLPQAVFIVDPQNEHIAVREARRLRIPILALTDTNCDPTVVDHVLPGNDDAIRSIRLVTSKVADACLAGLERRRGGNAMATNAQGSSSGVQVDFAPARRQRGPGAANRAPAMAASSTQKAASNETTAS